MNPLYKIGDQLYFYNDTDNSITAVVISGILFKPAQSTEMYYTTIGSSEQLVPVSALYSDISKLADVVVARETDKFNSRMESVKANIQAALTAFTPASEPAPDPQP